MVLSGVLVFVRLLEQEGRAGALITSFEMRLRLPYTNHLGQGVATCVDFVSVEIRLVTAKYQ